MKTFSATIKLDNAAFDSDWRQESARILRKLADKLAEGDEDAYWYDLVDSNGNKVGLAKHVEGKRGKP